jgi:hypothetical protein
MGPLTLFDKSFLQSLSLDESVWFDNFFLTNVCPLFFVETLADLGKSARPGRSAEAEVRIIASKFPELHGTPNVHHLSICTAELFGHKIPVSGEQMVVAGGRAVKADGKTGVVFDASPESRAFSRWQNEEFSEIERDHATLWREMLTNLDLREVAAGFKKLGIDGKSCKSLAEAKQLAVSIVRSKNSPFDVIRLAFHFLGIRPQYHREIVQRWSLTNYAPLAQYAPYTAHVLSVELFFQIALAANLISSDRASNRVDIGYLFYLPFCMIFVSSDKLHQKCAPLFLRNRQQFIWGTDLKSGLKELNAHYSALPTVEQDKGISSFAVYPPKDGDFLVSRIWDFHFPDWRSLGEIDVSGPEIKHKELSAMVRRTAEAPAIPFDELDFDPAEADSMTIERRVQKKKGSWFQIPKNIDEHDHS